MSFISLLSQRLCGGRVRRGGVGGEPGLRPDPDADESARLSKKPLEDSTGGGGERRHRLKSGDVYDYKSPRVAR